MPTRAQGVDAHYERHYLRLVGKTILAVVKDPTHDMGTVFGLQLDSGETVWILCDPEGNGPGHLELQPKP